MTIKELKEQERLAYITGDIEKAKMLAELVDAYQEIDFLENRDDTMAWW